MEYTSKKQTEELKEIGVDVMTSDLYISSDEKIHTQLSTCSCPRCHGELIWMSDFMRSEVEGDEEVELDDDALVSYFQCKDCKTMVEVVDPWPDEEGDGALFRIAWSADALMKLITDKGFDFILTRSKHSDKQWKMDVFADEEHGGIFKKEGKEKIDVLCKSVVEIHKEHKTA